MVLIVFRPLEFSPFSIEQLFIWSFIFSAIIGLTILGSVTALIKLLGSSIRERWKVKNEVLLFLFVLTVISLVIFGFFILLNPKVNKFDLFKLIIIRTFATSLFPVFILVLYEQNHYQKVKLRQVERLNQELRKKAHPLPQSIPSTRLTEKIVLLAENEKLALQLMSTSLYYVRSEGNYVEVFYCQNQKIQKALVRNSMKAIEEQLSAHGFFRCHNRFIVNLKCVQSVEGNTRNFELVLENVNQKIPVSRSKSKILIQLFQQSG